MPCSLLPATTQQLPPSCQPTFFLRVDTMSMMPSRGVRRIDRRLVHQSAWNVHPRKSITAILHKPRLMDSLGTSTRVNSRMSARRGWVAKSEWLILSPAYPREKLAQCRGCKHTSLTFLVNVYSEVSRYEVVSLTILTSLSVRPLRSYTSWSTCRS